MALCTFAQRLCSVSNAHRLTTTATTRLRIHRGARAMASGVTYLSQEDAVKVDKELMGPLGFSVHQLMELAGLSVASAVTAEVPAASRILILAGPGNNGGDGLVAARHLHHFGHKVQICYPKPSKKELFEGLVTQCNSLKLPFIAADELPQTQLSQRYDAVIDAMFGFSFKGDPRPPFDKLLQLVVEHAEGCYLAAVDIPSGWDVESGPPAQGAMQPDMLISLTAPKKGCQHFKGTHYLGGRFVPPEIKERFQLQLPEFQGAAQCVQLPSAAGEGAASGVDVASMRQSDSNMAGSLDEASVLRDPIEQFSKWMEEAAQLPNTAEPNAVALATVSTSGQPSNRMVLLKGYDKKGFTFYTNYGSRKGGELESTAKAALCFYWEPLQRQVRVEGAVQKLSEQESTEYYHSRPRGSQIGAWCSAQSSVISGRQELEQRLQELQQKYADESQPIPKPDFWGGFRVVPERIEFWHARPSRLHDRLCFTRDSAEQDWSMQRLSP